MLVGEKTLHPIIYDEGDGKDNNNNNNHSREDTHSWVYGGRFHDAASTRRPVGGFGDDGWG